MDNFRDSYFQVDWDLTTKRLRGTYWGKQYDTGRGFAVTVINGGQVVAPTTEVLRLKWEKPDGTAGYVNATIVNGKFIVENIDQMFTVHGSVRADFELSVAGKFVASITFYVNVEKAVAVDAIESSSDFTALQVAIATADSIDARLAQTVKKGQVSINDININLGKITPNMVSDELLAQIAGDAAVNAVPADGSLTTEKLAPNSVTIEKTNFIKKSSNLINMDELIMGKVISSSGVLIDNKDHATSDSIDVRDIDEITSKYVSYLSWFNEGTFISRSNPGYMNTTTTQKPSGATTLIASVNTLIPQFAEKIMQINAGGTLLPFEPYYTPYIDGVDIADIRDGSVTSSKIFDKAVGIDKVDFITQSTNLLNMESLTTGKVISSSGTPVDNKDYAISESIDVRDIDEITSKYVSHLAWFKDGVFISRSDPGYTNTTTTQKPSGATTLVANLNTLIPQFAEKIMQINAGDTLLPFEPWGIEIKGLKNSGGQQTLEEFQSFDQFVVEGDLDTYYTAPTFPSKPDLESMTPQYLWNEADLLVEEFPHYVTKQLFGKDSSGVYDIPYYTLSPPKIPSLADHLQHVRPKMILIAGNHGYEKTASWIMVQAMREIAENWKNSSALETLRWNVDLIFVPNANPSSWPERARTNSNGVDISRNFEYRWDYAPVVPGTSKGSEPLSEVEAQYIDSLLRDNQQETIFFTSCHNMTTSDTTPERFIWYPASNKYQRNIGKEYLSRLSRKWKKDYEWLPQDDLTYFGSVDSESPSGSEGRQANLYGIQGGTFETSRIFKLEESPANQSSLAITLGVEAFINLLLVNLKHGTEYYNSNKKPNGKFAAT